MTTCAVCHKQIDFNHPADIDESLERLLAINAAGWEPGKPICHDCLTPFIRVRDRFAVSFPQFLQQGLKIIPTSMRLDAASEWRGKGVTIAFLDSGFFAHADLTRPANRILKYTSVVGRSGPADLNTPQVSSWHGMMTAVVAAGNGFLSEGLYRGIASESDVVLIKVGSASRIREPDIAKGLRWVIRNRKRYGIRVVNISCGGDREASYLDDELSQAAEDATRAGLVVVAATGNSGHLPNHPVLPPASAPSVITVGGLDDKNNLEFSANDMYRSSYGPTIDGLQKPELIAPGIWVAAPLLPGTPTSAQAAFLARLENARDVELQQIIKDNQGIDADLDQAAGLAPYLIRQVVWGKIRDNNVISGHYKHVDGTSFAAPIVSSIAAQMLEANSNLKPHEVKRALIATAARLPNVAVDRQGWGVVNPREAVKEIMKN